MTGGDSASITTTVEARSYAIPFSEVWDAARRAVSGQRGWSLLEGDSREGTFRLSSVNMLGKRPLEASVRLWLDELGQTRLEIRSEEPRQLLVRPAGATRLRRFIRRLEREMGLPRRP